MTGVKNIFADARDDIHGPTGAPAQDTQAQAILETKSDPKPAPPSLKPAKIPYRWAKNSL